MQSLPNGSNQQEQQQPQDVQPNQSADIAPSTVATDGTMAPVADSQAVADVDVADVDCARCGKHLWLTGGAFAILVEQGEPVLCSDCFILRAVKNDDFATAPIESESRLQ